ncbi:hypothetical protein LWF15_20345 [Kineosporia rhizophila]|uniref:hypothetical protein n=1 Tax=Kineosporia rhizophila TaxID=84633 RepID=UPI001E5D64F7|nr:hypothetical protein [Kineosporia rhizophila]MCE0537848.1 hypothetical protein [Kineosporia rhizophila]
MSSAGDDQPSEPDAVPDLWKSWLYGVFLSLVGAVVTVVFLVQAITGGREDNHFYAFALCSGIMTALFGGVTWKARHMGARSWRGRKEAGPAQPAQRPVSLSQGMKDPVVWLLLGLTLSFATFNIFLLITRGPEDSFWRPVIYLVLLSFFSCQLVLRRLRHLAGQLDVNRQPR